MATAVSRGQYYQRKTQKWLEAQGYVVGPLQLMAWFQTPQGPRPVKRDAFASDLLAVSFRQTVFCQVKGGKSCRSNLAAARAAFAKFPLGPGSQQWLVLWPPQAREPEVEIVATGPQAADHAVDVHPRRKAKPLPLFQQARPA